ACSRLPAIQYSADKVLHGSLNGHPIEHVVILAVDGLEQESLVKYLIHSPPRKPGGLHEFLGVRVDGRELRLTKGIAVLTPTTVFPSYTYPAWTSMFTGVFPGSHGITGNNLFFRDREVARYFTEFHIDAAKVQLEKNFFSNDINPRVNTMYEYVGQGGGQSLVVHHMLTRGSGAGARNADLDTLLSYEKNHSEAVDDNALWDAVKALQDFNGGAKEGTDLELPAVMTIYFAGLDHAEHLSPGNPEKARLEYLKHIDDLIAKFIGGDPGIVKNHQQIPGDDITAADPIHWRGLRNEPVMQRTLFLLVSDHGHTPIIWDKVLGMEDLKVVFEELTDISGRAYHLEEPVFYEETGWSLIRSLLGIFFDGTISGDSNIVATLNGGSLGFHVKPEGGQWKDDPDFQGDIVPMLKHVLLTLHQNQQGPEAVLYKHDNRYVFIPYHYDGTSIQLLAPVDLNESPLNHDQYPLAVRRVTGLAARLPEDPVSAPDIILLADREKGLSYFNKQDWRVLEKLDVTTHRHFHSDHGHLRASDSLVPIIFVRGEQEGNEDLAAICEASIVDVTPTILHILGLLPSFHTALQDRPDEVKGHSLKPAIERILTKAPSTSRENVCSSPITVSLP
ncbi:MAG: alkaline phosphatase family protein, partial [Nitrospirales bacterium]